MTNTKQTERVSSTLAKSDHYLSTNPLESSTLVPREVNANREEAALSNTENGSKDNFFSDLFAGMREYLIPNENEGPTSEPEADSSLKPPATSNQHEQLQSRPLPPVDPSQRPGIPATINELGRPVPVTTHE